MIALTTPYTDHNILPSWPPGGGGGDPTALRLRDKVYIDVPQICIVATSSKVGPLFIRAPGMASGIPPRGSYYNNYSTQMSLALW